MKTVWFRSLTFKRKTLLLHNLTREIKAVSHPITWTVQPFHFNFFLHTFVAPHIRSYRFFYLNLNPYIFWSFLYFSDTSKEILDLWPHASKQPTQTGWHFRLTIDSYRVQTCSYKYRLESVNSTELWQCQWGHYNAIYTNNDIFTLSICNI